MMSCRRVLGMSLCRRQKSRGLPTRWWMLIVNLNRMRIRTRGRGQGVGGHVAWRRTKTRRRTGTRGPSAAASLKRGRSRAVCGMGQQWQWPLRRSWGEKNWGKMRIEGGTNCQKWGKNWETLKRGEIGKKLIWVRVCQCAIRLCNNGPSWNILNCNNSGCMGLQST